MNQEKIGAFIAECRKAKNMTQAELAEKLGVTDKSVGNWENARCMPDLSLFKPLCEELGITINDLLSGEKISKDKYQEKFEENMVNTIDYSTKKINKYSNIIGLILVVFGLFISISAIMIFPSESSWGSIYSTFGIIIFVIGISKLTKKMKLYERLLLILVIFLGSLGILHFTDYINVKTNNVAPMFRISTTYLGSDEGELLYYDSLFYDVIRCGDDFKIVKDKKYSHEDLFAFCERYYASRPSDVLIKSTLPLMNIHVGNKDCVPVSLALYSDNTYELFTSYKECEDGTPCSDILRYTKSVKGTYDYDLDKILASSTNANDKQYSMDNLPEYEIYLGEEYTEKYNTLTFTVEKGKKNKYLNELLKDLDINLKKCASPDYEN